jgi:hypothetical protein
MSAEKKEGILHQPVGDLLRKEIDAGELFRKELHIPESLKRDITIPEALKREITLPEILKREIPVGNFLSKEITFRRRKETAGQVTCFACGNETPGTVSRCLHCDAVLGNRATVADEPVTDYVRESVSLIDMDW